MELRAELRQLGRFVERDVVDDTRSRHEARIAGEQPVDVRPDLDLLAPTAAATIAAL